jgi:general secretion pathway protein G
MNTMTVIRHAPRSSGFDFRTKSRAAGQGWPVRGFDFRTKSRAARQGCRACGFTLIEILVVVVILGILAGLIVPRIMDRPDQARVVAAKSDIAAIMNALKLYRLDNGTYPSAEQGLMALVKKPETGDAPRNWKPGGYLERLPKDPWGSDYQYLNPGLQAEIDVISFGADRQPGGEDYNADIGSWSL